MRASNWRIISRLRTSRKIGKMQSTRSGNCKGTSLQEMNVFGLGNMRVMHAYPKALQRLHRMTFWNELRWSEWFHPLEPPSIARVWPELSLGTERMPTACHGSATTKRHAGLETTLIHFGCSLIQHTLLDTSETCPQSTTSCRHAWYTTIAEYCRFNNFLVFLSLSLSLYLYKYVQICIRM